MIGKIEGCVRVIPADACESITCPSVDWFTWCAMLRDPHSLHLGPGVYILRDFSRVVWVGSAPQVVLRVAAHLSHRRGDPRLPGLPLAPVRFDRVEVRPCLIEELATRLAATRAELRWSEPAPPRATIRRLA